MYNLRSSAKTGIGVIVICLCAMTGLIGCQNIQDKNKNRETDFRIEDRQSGTEPKTGKKLFIGTRAKADGEGEDPCKNTVDFEELLQINPDAYAWIKIPDTAVDYPILQNTSEPDDYYLKRTIDLHVGYPGSIYTEKRNSRDCMDPVTVVYGHNMRDGSMFADLHKYGNAEFFAANPYFYIYLPDKTLKYHIFSAVTFNDKHILKNYDFENEEELLNYYNDLMSCETGNTDKTVAVTEKSRILTMSTCIDGRPDLRWLVNGVLISTEKKPEE